MHTATIRRAATLILEESIKVLARIHKCSEVEIHAGLRAENAKLVEQFGRLVAEGCRAAADTMADRLDILEAVVNSSPVGA